jgi:ABC-2 type transport system ATP-binding protein
MDHTLEVQGLCKNYGSLEAVRDVSFTVDSGEVFALIGPNGAGKTTTIRMIATLLAPTEGDALIGGISVREHPDRARAQLTYLPDEAGAYKTMTGRGYLEFIASLFTDDPALRKKQVDAAVEICGLGERIDDKIGTYSRGMSRKLLLSRAIMTRPKLAILDEPTSGLDVINALEIRKIIKSLAKEGMSFLISSHNMLEIEFVSSRVGIIDKGVLHVTGKPEELKAQYGAANLEEVFERVVAK